MHKLAWGLLVIMIVFPLSFTIRTETITNECFTRSHLECQVMFLKSLLNKLNTPKIFRANFCNFYESLSTKDVFCMVKMLGSMVPQARLLNVNPVLEVKGFLEQM